MTEADAIDRVARLSCWSGAVEIAPLGGGITNRNFVVTDTVQGRFVARLGDDIPVHGVMRFNELSAARAAHAAGLSPEVVHAEPGVLVTRHIDGVTFDPGMVRAPENRGRIVELIRRCHTEVPKYLRPRTDTPKLTVGHGGCFSCIYSVRGAGGYQMFGITPMPIYDPKQEISYLKEFMIFFKPGDIVKFNPVTREEYDRDLEEVAAGRFYPGIRKVTFSLDAFQQDPTAYNAALLGGA